MLANQPLEDKSCEQSILCRLIGEQGWTMEEFRFSLNDVSSSLPSVLLVRYLTGMVDKRTLEKYEREAKEKNRETW